MVIQKQTRVVFETERKDAEGIGVTVIVTLYNYEQYIKNALDSVLKQGHSNIELIIVDDASTDNSKNAARTWLEKNGARFSHARLLSHVANSGISQARNTAFENAANDYVFVLDADNEIYPAAIAKLLEACISANAEAAYSRIEVFGAEKGILGAVWKPSRFAKGNYIDAMALIRKSAWREAGGYTLFKIQGWEDYDLWCKFVELGFRGEFVPELLCRYRVHKSSMLRTTTNPNLDRVRAEMKVLHPWLKIDEPPSMRDKLSYWLWLFRVRLMRFRNFCRKALESNQ